MLHHGTSHSKDAFLQLLLLASLYLSATHLGVLLFQIINHYLPSPVEGTYIAASIAQQARWAIAVLVIIAPVFFWITRHLRTAYDAAPDKLALPLRRWFVALTMFLAAAVTIGDLIAVVNEFLSGDLTLRFLLKALTVLLIAGTVLWYERWEFRRDRGGTPPTDILALRWGVMVVTVAAIVVGFSVVGSPASVRKQQFDAQRVSDLTSIQWSIVTYWQQKGALPTSIDVLRDDIAGYIPPRDPATRAAYEYTRTGDLTFELCAVFASRSSDGATRDAYRIPPPLPPPLSDDGTFGQWRHDAERTCFTRTIDPERHWTPSAVPLFPSDFPPPLKQTIE